MKKIVLVFFTLLSGQQMLAQTAGTPDHSFRQRVSINDGWRFYRYDSLSTIDDLIYDVRPEVNDRRDDKAADARPTEAVAVEAMQEVLKPWILPTGNNFVK